MVIFIVFLFIFSLGLTVGSFLNVLISRLPKGESIISPRSKCPNCGSRIPTVDLIPVLSYVFLGGRCRNCKAAISLQYPVIELLTAILFTAIFAKYLATTQAFSYMALACFLIVLSFIDLNTMEVPDAVTMPGMLAGFVFSMFNGNILSSVFGAAFGFSFMLLLGVVAKMLLKRDAMGDGDATIAMMIGAFLGIVPTFYSIFIAFLIGGVIGVVLLLFRVRRFGEMVPFGPMLAAGAILFVLFQDRIMLLARHLSF